MADVFLSYVGQDQRLAVQVAAALRESGIEVWWNPDLFPPSARADGIAREFASAKCVVVLWSEHSVNNEAVLAEAEDARGRDILVSAVVGKPRLPVGFRDLWYADLTHWTDDPGDENFLILKRLIESRLRPERPRVPQHDAPSTSFAGTSSQSHVDQLPTGPSQRASSLFLCYRREDTQDAAGRLHDRLAAAYGFERVFMDIDSVPLGIDFVDHVTEQISRCSVVIVMIGKQWLTIKDKKRRRRLDREDDLVRAEIRAALQQKVPVIPVVVQNASMPLADDLPDDIRLLARRNGIQLLPEQWREGVERLLKELDRVMGKPSDS